MRRRNAPWKGLRGMREGGMARARSHHQKVGRALQVQTDARYVLARFSPMEHRILAERFDRIAHKRPRGPFVGSFEEQIARQSIPEQIIGLLHQSVLTRD